MFPACHNRGRLCTWPECTVRQCEGDITMEDSKKWWQSRTMWVNIVGFIFSIMVALGVQMPEGMDESSVVAAIMAVVNIVNMVLRVISNKMIA